jgi:hypothetical protein
MPGESGVTVVTISCAFLFLHMRLRRVERPAFPAPSEFQMASHRQNSRGSRGENAEAWVNYARRHCAHDNGIAGLHPSSREAVGSRRAKLALSFPSSREAVGRVAGRRPVGWGLSAERQMAPHPALRATLPTSGRDKKERASLRPSPQKRAQLCEERLPACLNR